MPVVLITPVRWSRSPIQTLFLGLLSVAGFIIIFGFSDSKVIEDVGEPWSSIWAGGLILGSLISLVGAYWRDQIDGMLIERSGIFLLGLIGFYWFCAVLVTTKLDGVISECFGLVFSAVCYLQVKYINQHIDMILQAIDRGGHIRE